MDLGTIQTKLNQSKYQNTEKFAADVRLVWRNAMTYNRPDSDIYRNAEKLAKMFERKFSTRKSVAGTAGAAAGDAKQQAGGPKRKRPDGKEGANVTRQDRVTFSKLVDKLSSDELGQLVDMIQRDCPTALNEEDEKEIEIEINAIDSATLLNLIDFCQQCVTQALNKKKANTPAAGDAAQASSSSSTAPMQTKP